MKKWLIFAVIAAMFAMVMFPACGKDEGGEAVAENVIAKLEGSDVIVTWTGDVGSDYAVYSLKQGYPLTSSGDIKLEIDGQRLLRYYKDYNPYSTTAGNYVSGGETNPQEEQWSAIIESATSGIYRFGVGPVNAGGYPIEQTTIVWYTATVPGAAETDPPIVDQGFIEIP